MPRFTFSKKEHLLKRWEFERVYNSQERYIGRYLRLFLLRDQPDRKIGIIAGRKTGNAVKRNRFKRLVREVYRLNKPSFADKIHIVVTAKFGMPDLLEFKDIESDLMDLFKKAGILCVKP